MKILGNIGITKLIDLIASKFAPKDSPELTGTPTAPTPESGDNSTQIATTEFVNSKAREYLPLNGGIMNGSIYATPSYDSNLPYGGKVTFGTKGKAAKGTMPPDTEWHTMFVATDNTGNVHDNDYKYGQVETAVKVDGSTETKLEVFKNEANSKERSYLAVGFDVSGNAYTYAPTPTTGDNSTKIATTAFVNTKTGEYLPLSGGTMNGYIHFLPNVGSNQTGRFIVSKAGTKGTMPEQDTYFTIFIARDESSTNSNSALCRYATLEAVVRPNGSTNILMAAHKNIANVNETAILEVGFDANGNKYTSVPGKVTIDNHAVLQYNTTNQCLDFSFV